MNLDQTVSALSAKAQPLRQGQAAGTHRHRLVLMHPLDPRGKKIGGIESHVRLVLEYAPADWSVLFVGVDGQGNCRLGEVTPMTFRGRIIDFLPVLFYPEDRVHEAAGESQRINHDAVHAGIVALFPVHKKRYWPGAG